MANVKNIQVKMGVVRDWNVAQGVSHPTDLSSQIIRDYNLRYVSVQNSSPYTPVGISIMDSFEKSTRIPINFTMAPGEIRALGINSFGARMQYLHIFDLKTRQYLGDPTPFATNANTFVLREGINKWFVQRFHQPSFSAAK